MFKHLMLVLFTCGCHLTHVCYFDFNVCPARAFLWCTIHIIFVTDCDSFYIKKYVNDPEGYAADLYHNISISLTV
jgi:hypothetical protein